MRFKRVVLIVLDSVGVGELPDADSFGDAGAHTVGHILKQVPTMKLPHLDELGLGNLIGNQVETTKGYYGKMKEVSVGKDTMTGHWEIMGLKVMIPFQTYPNGFSKELLDQFEAETGRGILGNLPASGTEILEQLGEEQMKTGKWIVYTSADSVLQIATHEEIIPLEELYRACEIARRLTKNEVGRVIARPYLGKPGNFVRTSNRKDYAIKPPEETVMNYLKNSSKEVIAIGKISDIYSGEGVTRAIHTKSNLDGIIKTIEEIKTPFEGLLFTNLVDFDSLFGHRRDPQGYAKALEEFDNHLPDIIHALQNNDLLIITADHGNDPTHHGTDHTREYVPLFVYSPSFKSKGELGIRETFSDIGATIAENFSTKKPVNGKSFLQELEGNEA